MVGCNRFTAKVISSEIIFWPDRFGEMAATGSERPPRECVPVNFSGFICVSISLQTRRSCSVV